MKAVTLCGSTKTWYSCSAEAWNSISSVRVIVLTSGPELGVAFPEAGFELEPCVAEEEEAAAGFGVTVPDAGLEPGAC